MTQGQEHTEQEKVPLEQGTSASKPPGLDTVLQACLETSQRYMGAPTIGTNVP